MDIASDTSLGCPPLIAHTMNGLTVKAAITLGRTDSPSSLLLSKSLSDCGFVAHETSSWREAVGALAAGWPSLAIIDEELEDDRTPLVIAEMRAAAPGVKIAVITRRILPTVGIARLLEAGANAIVMKPATAPRILSALQSPPLPDGPALKEAQPRPMSLGRARWEYIQEVLFLSGSVAEAARRLGIFPRSLRRMLEKTPPSY